MIGPKEKKERSVGEQLFLKGYRCNSPKCAMVRKPYRPGVHGKARRRALSEYGRQIKEKQKFKLSYGLDEQNLRSLFARARRAQGSVAERLLELLERRLDNVIFRLGFAPSRSMARQLVVHGHILVNGKRVRSPGFSVVVGSRIDLRDVSKGKAIFAKLRDSLKQYNAPSWLAIDAEELSGTVLSAPTEDPRFEINTLVESFSK